MVRKLIEKKLRLAFAPIYLDVVDETYRHKVPIYSESHFNVVVVSNHFISKRWLTRHRSIYSVLSKEFEAGMYALALHAYTLKEWTQKQNKLLDAPLCCGGVAF